MKISTKKIRILYIDIYLGGHHFSYTKNLIQRLIEKGCLVDILTTRGALDNFSYKEFVDVLPRDISVFNIVNDAFTKLPLPQTLRTWIALKIAFSSLKKNVKNEYDLIFFPNFSGIYQAIGFLGSPFGKNRIFGLLISIRFHLSRVNIRNSFSFKDFIHERLFFRFLANNQLAGAITIDPELLNDQKVIDHGCSRKIKYFEHPFSVKKSGKRKYARAKYGIKQKTIAILVFGTLTQRKAIDTLIDAAADPRLNRRVTVILAGVPDGSVSDTLRSRHAQELRKNELLIEELRFVSEEEESELFSATDIVWVAYRNFYDTSGVLMSAYINSKPVIGCNVGHISRAISHDKTGIIVNPESYEDVLTALINLTSSIEIRDHYGENGRIIAKYRNPDKFFKSIVNEGIRICCD